MDTSFSNAERAQVLTQALPYIQQYNGKIVVVKYGGNAMVNEQLKQQVMEDIVLLWLIGVKVVLVHGGGPEISEIMGKLGKQAVFVDGLRVTDKETVDIVQMVLAGKINKTLVNLLEMKGGNAMGISGMDGRLIEAQVKDPRLGYVGEITQVNIQPVLDLLEKGYIPVISTLGCDDQGNAYNINGDTAAASVAGALRAERLIMLSDIPGILRDKNDPSTLIREMTILEAAKLRDDGVISDGMIPKVECCVEAIRRGVHKVIIMDGRVPHSIGPNLPIDRVTAGVARMAGQLSDSPEAGTAASRAIMTTDTVNKEFAVEFDLPAADGGRTKARLGGMSKGSGMIHPNMCTMLAYLTTDCAIDQALLQKAVSDVVADTFNMISVDGDTSTNDTLLVLANGMAGNRPITGEGEAYQVFRDALRSVCHDLAVKMAGDGEGATHLLEMRVYNADTKENARILAKSVIGSSLVKAMVFGRDANCGRILCALGYAGPDFDPAKIEVFLHGEKDTLCFYQDGCVQAFDEELALSILSGHDVRFSCNMNMGTAEATAWGCDLTYDYVKINGDYRT